MTDYFKLLDLNSTYQIDLDQLEKNYLRLQQKYHPDNYVNVEAGAARIQAINHSILINQAYNTIKSPLKRSEYLLKQQHIIVNTDVNDTIKPDLELLENVMEDKEYLQQITDKNSLIEFEQKNLLIKEKIINIITESFFKNDYKLAASNTIYLRYIYKLIEDIKTKKKILK
jgi:molecular chaperone HscB